MPFLIAAQTRPDPITVAREVSLALSEDIGGGDLTAQLIDAGTRANARIIAREAGVLCGTAWVNEVFRQLDPDVAVHWLVHDGDRIEADQPLLTLEGAARSLLTGERTALNFLQLLSGTASRCRALASLVEGTGVRLLDTRKTLPGLRLAQKYAVQCGGCENHRIGLYDAFLIKENHISACGSISAAINAARRLAPNTPLEVEVENLEQLHEALACAPDRIMLDNFTLDALRTAVAQTAGRIELEASGNATADRLRALAETGVNYISIGALTKDVKALDLSMRITAVSNA